MRVGIAEKVRGLVCHSFIGHLESLTEISKAWSILWQSWNWPLQQLIY